ncbi:insulin-like growth factor-binding protein-related protein 1 [Daktulosphaira vitifoliae]|uniref:insulin-like growth factor-binding protein-related protein 1 n=1 Tax=Daktulosphaira vitifoliae TaxID=58002 RepID=UPI0021AA9538|nr:insulin-like growth factor-binding protein-related protein 1 [Daktulosphaira vitifoliae]
MRNRRATFIIIAAAVLAAFFVTANGVKRSDLQCPEDECATIHCPHDQSECLLGLVPDGCDCCPYGVCGHNEGSECNAKKPCANTMECVKLEEDETIYRCVCKEKEIVCGSDNSTYLTVCHLNEVSAKLGNNSLLLIQYLGPCTREPSFNSFPKDVYSTIGQPVIFECEIKGFPVPNVSWSFTDTAIVTKSLPGDDIAIAIQTRGGPNRFTVTSWVQILDFKPEHVGNYTCIGTNSEGTSMASAKLGIREIF